MKQQNSEKVYSYSTKSIRNEAYSKPAWVKRNWLRIGIGIFALELLRKWKMVSTPVCECDVK